MARAPGMPALPLVGGYTQAQWKYATSRGVPSLSSETADTSEIHCVPAVWQTWHGQMVSLPVEPAASSVEREIEGMWNE